MPTPTNLAQRLTRFSMAALEAGSALAAKPHVVTHLGRQTSLISWECAEAPDLSNTSLEDIRSYMFFLENEHFSLVGEDGAIIQMSFKIHRGEIIHHRLCYLPCPVLFDPDELLEDNLYDIVDRNMASRNFDLLRYRGALRFDYDPEAETDVHPSSHMTFNYDQVRVPVGRNFDASTFLRFIDKFMIASRSSLKRMDHQIGGDPTRDVLSDVHRCEPHVTWRPANG